MTRRLVLGNGAVCQAVVGVLSTWQGTVHVVVDDDARAEALRGRSVQTTVGDPADSDRYPKSVETVLVASSDATECNRIATAARARFPDAFLAIVVDEATPGERADLASLADRVVDGTKSVSTSVLSLAHGETVDRLHKLRRLLRSIDGRLAVVTHDNPDPDAIGSAIALRTLAKTVGVSADACYYGEISHQENRALVNLLDLELTRLSLADDIESYEAVALVDHSRPGVNDSLPTETRIDVVVDHHPPRAPIEAGFVDLRSDVGATSTILAEYFKQLGLDPGRSVATALLYGIRVDTKDFTREASDTDFEAAAFLAPFVDTSVLERVETPSMSAEVLETLAKAVRNRDVRGEALTSGVGRIRDRDALAQAADRLLNMEGVKVTLVYGIIDDVVFASGRARGTSVDLGETLRDALGPIGSAGGHGDMAGAQLPIGILADVSDESAESLTKIVDEVIKNHFYETLELAPSTPDVGTDDDTFAFEFPLDWSEE